MTTLLNVKLKSFHILIITFTVGLLMTLIFGFMLYNPILRFVVKSQKALKPGNEMRKFYLKLPIPLDFRVYFFNISNPEEVQEGGKPVLQEIGPYCYDAYKEKIVVSENKENDTLTYSPYDTYFFNSTRSGDLSQDDYITILNPLTVGIINAVAMQKPQFLSAINKALPIIFKDDYSIYLTTRVRDILFDGVRIDCNVKDFSAKAVCSQFKGQPAMKQVGPNTFSFSILGSRNGSSPQQITVYRGIKNGDTLGRVVAINNQSDLGVWSEERCNEFKGTDAPDLCRNFRAQYVEDLKFHSVSVKKYVTVLGNDTCYCPTPDTCLPKGVMDLTKCLQVPLFCTLPHFLEVDEELLTKVEGLHPDRERHIIKVLFEPVTGTPMLGQRRLQFNLQLHPLAKVPLLKNVSDLLHPIMWLEEGVELEGYLLNKIITVSTLLKLGTAGRYVCLVFCLEFIAYGCYQAYKDWKSAKVGPVEKKEDEEEEETDSESFNDERNQNGDTRLEPIK